MDHLLAQGPLDEGTEIYLDALSDLVGSYEDAHHPITPASAAAMLRHLMEAKAITQANSAERRPSPSRRSPQCSPGKNPLVGR